MNYYTEEDMKSLAKECLMGEIQYSGVDIKFVIAAIDEYFDEWKKTHPIQTDEIE